MNHKGTYTVYDIEDILCKYHICHRLLDNESVYVLYAHDKWCSIEDMMYFTLRYIPFSGGRAQIVYRGEVRLLTTIIHEFEKLVARNREVIVGI